MKELLNDFLIWLKKPDPDTILIKLWWKKRDRDKAIEGIEAKRQAEEYRQKVKEQAYLLWEADGRQEGKDEYYWKLAVDKVNDNNIPCIYQLYYWVEKHILEPSDAWIKRQSSISILSQLAILAAIIAFIGSEEIRYNNEIFNAWQTITSAEGQTGSGGRIEALEFLNSRPLKFPWIGWTKEDWFWDEKEKECKFKQLLGLRWERQSLAGLSALNAYLGGIHLCGADLAYADLSGVNFWAADLSGAYLIVAKLNGASLLKTDLSGANFWAADLSGADLRHSDLSKADLSIAHLEEVDLSEANLSEANLSGADLSGVNFWAADLSKADLSIAHLEKANLSEANLSEADLKEADFNRANLSGANLSGANFGYSTSFRPDEISPFKKLLPRDSNYLYFYPVLSKTFILTGRVKNLTPNQVKSACYWEEVHFNSKFMEELEQEPDQKVDCSYWEKEN